MGDGSMCSGIESGTTSTPTTIDYGSGGLIGHMVHRAGKGVSMTTEKTDDPFWAELHKQAAAHPTERSRLRDDVVRAARAWFRGEISEGGLRIAIMALEQFELAEEDSDTVEEHALSTKSADIEIQLTGVEAKCSVGSVVPMASYDPVSLLSEPTSMEQRAELLRLRCEVLDKAKLWSAAIVQGAYAQIQADNELRDALDALEHFEANEK